MGSSGQTRLNVEYGNVSIGQGTLYVGSDFTVDGDADINGDLTLDGSSIFETTGQTRLRGSTNVSGIANFSNYAHFQGPVGIDADFDINTNKFTVEASTAITNIAGALTASGNLYLGDELQVTGSTTLSDSLVVQWCFLPLQHIKFNGGSNFIEYFKC